MNLPSGFNQTFDVKSLECITPLPFFFLKCYVLHSHLDIGFNRRRRASFRSKSALFHSNSVSASNPPREYTHYYCDTG
jgi:hypothetical protein